MPEKIIMKTMTCARMDGCEYHRNKSDFEKRVNPTHNFHFKTTNKLFSSCEDIISYLKILKLPQNKFRLFENYEIIYSDQPVPLYFDLDYKNKSKDDIKSLNIMMKYLALFMKQYQLIHFDGKYNDGFDSDYGLELMSKFSVLSATREVEIESIKYIKHSYHLILRDPKIHFKNQSQILIFMAKFKEWLKDNADDFDKQHLMVVERGRSHKLIWDESIYSRSAGKMHSLRTINSHKGGKKTSEILTKWTHPSLGGGVDGSRFKYKEYFVNYIPSGSKCVILPEGWDYDDTKVVISDYVPISQGLDDPPIYIKNKILSLLNKQFKNYNLLSIKLNGDKFFFNFDSEECCPMCGCSHEGFSNKSGYTFWYNTNNSNIALYCRTASKEVRIYDNNEDNLLIPDYSYEDTEEIKCKPLLSIDEMPEYGTFFLESAKGTGKSEAIKKFLDRVPDDKSILIISYRVSLINKYVEELKQYNIKHYKEGLVVNSDFDRVAICKESLGKLFSSQGKYKYDIIIIDEIYSVLESWDSNLRKDISDLMNIFEIVVRNAKYLYLMDAHLNDSLVLNCLRTMRKEEKFIFHKNPRLYDYSDYEVNWYENRDDDASIGFQNMIIKDLINGKKIAVVSSTKTYVDNLYAAIRKHGDIPPTLLKYKYTSAPEDEKVKNEHFADVEKYWSENCVVLYSPTVSAGISYNLTGQKGFDKLYVYLTPVSRRTASINTFGQMIFRIRQLNDKKINIFFDIKQKQKLDIEEHQIENRLDSRCNILSTEFGLPMRNNGICLDTLRPLYDREHWSYNIWFETTKNKIKYNKISNFKEYFKNLLCNKPNDIFAGRGMKFFDHSEDLILIEDDEKQFLENIAIDEKKDKLERDFENYYLNTSSKDRDYLEKTFGKNIVEFNNSCIKLIKKNDKTDEEIVEYEKSKKKWKRLTGVGYQYRFRRFNDWLSDNVDHSFTKMLEKYLKDSATHKIFWDECAKPLKIEYNNSIKPQVIESLMYRGFHLHHCVKDVCDLLGLPKNIDLHGSVISREKFEKALSDREKLNNIFDKIKGQTSLFKEVKRKFNLLLRNNIKKWQLAHPDTCVYDLDEEGVKQFFKETGVNHNYGGFKKSEFKKGISKKDEKIKEFASGEWCYPEWKSNDPYEFTTETFKNAVSKVLECTLNFKLETVKNGSSYKWKEQRIVNLFVRDEII